MRSFFSRLATIPIDSLTNNETKLIEYIKIHSKEIVKTNMKIERLAQEVGTGYSAIYALLKKLRFQGYKDFSMALANDQEESEYALQDGDEEITTGYISVIRKNHNLIEKRSLFNTLNYIRSAKRIFVCNWENILISPAIELSNYFYRCGFNTHLLDADQETVQERVSTSGSDDLFVFYTKYADSTRLRDIIRQINKSGAKVVVISGKTFEEKNRPEIDVAHYLLVDTELERGLESNFSKSVPFHYFNDLLIFHYNNKYLNK
jgi:DNA-binding MurR/RpiR family transcriptional regulator